MVSGTRIGLIFWNIIVRVLLFGATLYVGAYTSTYVLKFMENSLEYQKPAGFFGFTLEHALISWTLASVFWIGIFFGSIGKKSDYIIIGTFTILGLISFYGLGLEM